MSIRDAVSTSSWSPPSSPSQLPYIREVDEFATSRTHPDLRAQPSSSDDAPTESDVVHFATKIGRKWACHVPGHEICFVEGNTHTPLSDEQIMTWVGAWYEGRATVTSPPEEVFRHEASASPSSGLSENELVTPVLAEYPHDVHPGSSYMDLKVHEKPPSSLYRQPYLTRSPYFPDREDEGSTATNRSMHRMSGVTERSAWSPNSTVAPSSPTPTSCSDSTLQGNEKKSKAKWLAGAVTLRHGMSYIAKLKKYQKRHQKLGKQERIKTLRIIGHAVEMSRKGHSSRVHKVAYEIARELQKWFQMFTEKQLHACVENTKLLLVVQACLIPILLRRVSVVDPGSSVLASELSNALTKIPLPLQDSDMNPSPLFYSPTSPQNRSPSIRSEALSSVIAESVPFNDEDTPTYSIISTVSSVVINLVANELGSEQPTCKNQHPWLGLYLLRIVEMTLKLRHEEGTGLTREELDAIWTIGIRREEQLKQDSSEKLDTSLKYIRPHEVALLALCASSLSSGSLSSFFTLSVLGRTGVPLLVSSLHSLLEPETHVQWEDVALILRALAFLSEHAWVIRGLSNTRESGASGLANERVMIKALLAVFRRSIPERWLSLRFWAMDTIRNMLSQRPGIDLVRILTAQEAIGAFESLFDKHLSRVGDATSNHASRSSSHVRAPPDDPENVRQRMKETYRRDAAVRAEELVRYLKIWERVADEHEDPDLKGKPQLNVVSVAGLHYDM